MNSCYLSFKIFSMQAVYTLFALSLMIMTISGQTSQGYVPQSLIAGQTIKRSIKDEKLHFYRIELKRGQVIRIECLPVKININLGLFITEDRQLKFLKGANIGGVNQLDKMLWESDRDGVYMLAVEIFETPTEGEYELVTKVEDQLTNTEMQWLRAESLYLEAKEIFNKNSPESFRAATEKLQQASSILETIGDKYYQAIVLRRMALVKLSLDETEEALTYFNRALPLFREVKDINGEALTLNNIGHIYSSLWEKETALNYYEKALSSFKQVGDLYGEAMALNNIGYINNLSGEKREALKFYNQALPLRRLAGDKMGEVSTLNNIGYVYDSLGEKQEALKYYFQALKLSKKTEDKDDEDKDTEAATLTNIGLVLSYLGNKEEAVKYYLQALDLFRSIRNRNGEATILTNLASILSFLGEKQEALKYYDKSLLLAREIGDGNIEAATLNNIGAVYISLNNTQEALKHYKQALMLFKVVGNKHGEAETLKNIMDVWQSLNTRTAIFYGKQSINKFQELRQSVKGIGTETEKVFLNLVVDNYKKLAEILIAEGRYGEAVQALNLFQDQQFFDYNRNYNEPIKQIVKTPREADFVSQYENSSNKVSLIGTQLKDFKRKTANLPPNSEHKDQLNQLQAQLKTASEEFLTILKQIETDFSKASDDKDKLPVAQDLLEMQTALRTVGTAAEEKTAAIYTLVGEKDFHILLITPDYVKSVSTPNKSSKLNAKIKSFYAVLQSPAYNPQPLGKELYDIIFNPIEADLKKRNIRTLMWQLDGNLRYIPMAALFDGEKYILEKYQTVVFTRADRKRLTRAISPNWTGTAFGSSKAQAVDLFGDGTIINFSALPGVSQELESIFRTVDSDANGIIRGEVFSDAEFTKTNFYETMKKRRPLVHISSHFSFRPGDDSRSFLVLGKGFLTLNEMKKQTDLFQDVELLTLSACNTAAAQADANGREIDGFAELAQRLGAGAVMATLWSVSDASTPWLMRDFYKTRQSTTKMNKAEALRKAQTALLEAISKIV